MLDEHPPQHGFSAETSQFLSNQLLYDFVANNLITMAHKCHGERKKLRAKEKLPRQKKNARDKKEIGHCKRKKLPAKEKHPQQKKNARGKKEIGRGKRKKFPAKEKLPQQKKNARGKNKLVTAKEKS